MDFNALQQSNMVTWLSYVVCLSIIDMFHLHFLVLSASECGGYFSSSAIDALYLDSRYNQILY